MNAVVTRKVSAADSGLRLDRWFKTHYPALKHGALEKLLRTGQIRVDGGRVKANRRLEEGETLRIPPLPAADDAPSAAQKPAPRKEDAAAIRAMTIYEDDAILALNKPFGLAVQGGARKTRHLDGMLGALERDGERPRLVHRLDQDTGGLIIVARTRIAAAKLSAVFQRHDIEKTYWALTVGQPKPREGTIRLAIAKRMVKVMDGQQERMTAAEGEDAKKAITDYMTLDDAHSVAFLALRPVTGRTHQLRVHCAAIGAPIVGDGKYGGPAARIEGAPEGLMLFCRSMTFPHPETGRRTTLVAPLEGRMAEAFRLFGFDHDAEVSWPDLKSKFARK